MIEEFMKYASNYVGDKTAVVRKVEHSLRVYESCIKYAEELGWSDGEVNAMAAIGLLHDIGKIRNPSCDVLNHGEVGAKILFEDGLIEKFIVDEKSYSIIKKAIEVHNRSFIPEDVPRAGVKFVKLLRDLDKLDKMYELSSRDISLNGEVSDIVKKAFDEGIVVAYEDVTNESDRVVMYLSRVYDLNYDEVIPEYKKYLEKYFDRVDNKSVLEYYYEKAICYLNERIGKIC